MYKLIKIDNNTWAYEDTMPDGDTVRFFVLDGEEKCLVIDSGYLSVNVHKMVEDLLETEGRSFTKSGRSKEILLANTHADMDHSGGNASFSAFYMTKEDYDIKNLKDQCPESELIPVEEGTKIELGGRTLRYIMTPGHTVGNTALLDLSNRILFAGDMVQTGTIFMFGPHRRPGQLAGSLLKLLDMKEKYDMIFACHGQMILPSDAVDKTLNAWNKVLNKEIVPIRRALFDTEVDLYECEFCSFFCNPE